MVLGDPGSGKTTLLKHFILASTDPVIGPATLGLAPDTIPVLIQLRQLQNPTIGLDTSIEEVVSKIGIGLDGPTFTRRLLQRRLLVLVDGLDEVADAKVRASVSHWLNRAIDEYPTMTFLITSRYAGYRGDARLDNRFLELHVQDIQKESAKQFIENWYRAIETQAEPDQEFDSAKAIARQRAEDLSQKIFGSSDLRISGLKDLARNPLMLQILCLVHRDQNRLPERRVELYDRCVSALLELWRQVRGIPVELDANFDERVGERDHGN